ncbi:hypothetical protein WJX73_004487 [Symbiochloris irregularis]|uniref:Divinyl chlorophyllide a 8-vinyl-reductase, chloroplastic n=1 Tax=Symbiochloris irregularis TaxID=706552 RepID=A0AAW1P5E2_9CHLO
MPASLLGCSGHSVPTFQQRKSVQCLNSLLAKQKGLQRKQQFEAASRRQQRPLHWARPCRHAARLTVCQAAAASTELSQRQPQDISVLVVGATGYIGKFVVKELIRRGYQVTAFARERSGIKGKNSKEYVIREFEGAQVQFGDITDQASLQQNGFAQPVDVVVSCMASRTGGKKDSWEIDYQATLNALEVAQQQGAKHFVLLSAVCVQKPLLQFQHAKLAFEAKLREATDITHSIVRPTAFFKSLAGQISLVKTGKPYVMFGDGTLASCKPISEADLARFMADCVQQKDKVNQVLPIGGPGRAWSARDQGQFLFELAGRKPNFIQVPVALMDGIIGFLDLLSKVFPGLEDAAEFGRIGRYYATESMLVWDDKAEKYVADATPSYGKDTLEDFFTKAVKDPDGLKGQELGDAAVF